MSAIAVPYEVHSLAHLLPEMRPAEYVELREDIAANGLREAITLYEAKVLDGRHRYRACTELGVRPDFTTYQGDAPAAFVISLNIKRRQLSQSQKAMIASDFAQHLASEGHRGQNLRDAPRDSSGRVMAMPCSNSKESEQEEPRSAERAAQQFGVGHAQVIRANAVKREDPELAERVRNGELTVGAAYKQVSERSPQEHPRRNGNGRAAIGTARGQQQAKAHARRFTDLANALTGYAQGIDSLDVALIRAAMEPAELEEWTRSLGRSLNALRRFRTDLQGDRES